MDYFQLSTRKRGFITATHTSTLDDGGEMMLFSIAMKEREPLISGECKKKKKRGSAAHLQLSLRGEVCFLRSAGSTKTGRHGPTGGKKVNITKPNNKQAHIKKVFLRG